jgi:predicted nuclease of predicted toxin-antitoxin system
MLQSPDGEVGMAKADDFAILEKGKRDGRVVVTLDADFHEHMMRKRIGDRRPRFRYRNPR